MASVTSTRQRLRVHNLLARKARRIVVIMAAPAYERTAEKPLRNSPSAISQLSCGAVVASPSRGPSGEGDSRSEMPLVRRCRPERRSILDDGFAAAVRPRRRRLRASSPVCSAAPVDMVAASSRASATVAMNTNITPASSTNLRGPPVCNVSPRTAMPSIEPTTGLATTDVGSEAVSEPARNDDC
jgi:hypothetical protein